MNTIRKVIDSAAKESIVSRHRARVSHQHWTTEVVPFLREAAAQLTPAGTLPEHRFVTLETALPGHQVFQIEGKIMHSGAAHVQLKDWPSKIVYAIDPSGAVIVSLFAHQVDPAAASTEPFIIDVYASASRLCGMSGRREIRRHVKWFLKLSNVSLSLRPRQHSRKFIVKLEQRHYFKETAFRSRADYRSKHDNLELGFGVGVVAGLFPLIFANFLPAISAEASTQPGRLQEILAEAAGPVWSNFLGILVAVILLFALKKRYS